MGLLNSKTRLMDTILTDEGRKQLTSGRFLPAYYSFSDAGAVYSKADIYSSGSSPEQNIATLLSFEAYPLPQDEVAYTADDSGGLAVRANNNYFNLAITQSTNVIPATLRVVGGRLVNTANSADLSINFLSSSAQFASLATSIITGSADNFRRLMLLKSPDLLYSNRDQFILNTTETLNFSIRNDNYLPGNVQQGNLQTTENLFNDRRLKHLDNFTYLQPVNKGTTTFANNSPNGNPIGNYNSAIDGNRSILSYNDLKNEFNNVRTVGNDGVAVNSAPQKHTVYFSETTINNRIMGQIFEIANGKITKLDVIDFGVFIVPTTESLLFPDQPAPQPINPDIVTQQRKIHVYFVGKVFLDPINNLHKYIHMFSIVFQG